MPHSDWTAARRLSRVRTLAIMAMALSLFAATTAHTAIDNVVTAAAQRHLEVLPVVLVAPAWDARHPFQMASPPDRPQPYADFTGALVRRYGPNGSFWTEHPELVAQPIRFWQI